MTFKRSPNKNGYTPNFNALSRPTKVARYTVPKAKMTALPMIPPTKVADNFENLLEIALARYTPGMNPNKYPPVGPNNT